MTIKKKKGRTSSGRIWTQVFNTIMAPPNKLGISGDANLKQNQFKTYNGDMARNLWKGDLAIMSINKTANGLP